MYCGYDITNARGAAGVSPSLSAATLMHLRIKLDCVCPSSKPKDKFTLTISIAFLMSVSTGEFDIQYIQTVSFQPVSQQKLNREL